MPTTRIFACAIGIALIAMPARGTPGAAEIDRLLTLGRPAEAYELAARLSNNSDVFDANS